LVLVVIAGELIPVLTDQVLCNRQASPPRSPRGPRALSQRESPMPGAVGQTVRPS